ncbi:MAG: S8 family serine peptidase, partial [Streptococcus sp.]|nr:S8 family serine peptidase [Streptococcus sp.]
FKFDKDLYDLVDFSSPKTGMYKGAKYGDWHDSATYKDISIFTNVVSSISGAVNVKEQSLDNNGNKVGASSRLEIPIDLVLKDRKTVDDLVGQPHVQMRITNEDYSKVFCVAGTGKASSDPTNNDDSAVDPDTLVTPYNSYTFMTYVPSKNNNADVNTVSDYNLDYQFYSANSYAKYNEKGGYIDVFHKQSKMNSADNIGGESFKYRNIGTFFDKDKIIRNEDGSKLSDKVKFVYIGKGQDEDLVGLNLKGKIAVMDRIYTKDLKYAFKKAADKGARAIMVVNTVNYYNRDNWTELPAMGYEEDEGTTCQVFSVSGDDGLKIWNMINPTNKTEVKRNKKEDFKDKLDQYYPIDMESFNKNRPKLGDEKELAFNFAHDTDKELYKEEVIVPAASTSWGPRVDLLLKPDVSAPGKNIKSTLNVIDGKSTYGYMSGTSMATPVVAASTVLIRPKLKEMLAKPVLKNLTGDDKIDLTTLTKIALQNTARPMMDPTGWKEKSLYYASPRQQGAGLINVANALRNDVIASFKNLDSEGLVNSYGS